MLPEKIAWDILTTAKVHNNPVFVTTDWHLFLEDKKNGGYYQRENFESILKPYTHLNENDVLLHLGDLVDKEFDDSDRLISIMRDIPCKKILIRGNNDIFEDEIYLDGGFACVVDKLVYNNILFTHKVYTKPHTCRLNVHGDSHGHGIYYAVPYSNQLDLWDADRRLIRIEEIDGLFEEYRKHVRDISDMHLSREEFKEWRGKKPIDQL